MPPTNELSGKQITVAGAGIVGLWQALTLARAGASVRLVDRSAEPFVASSSRYAAAMIAPECEAESAPVIVRDLGRDALAIWRDLYPGTTANGTLVVAAVRDRSELSRFQRATEGHRLLHGGQLAQLEPSLDGRFESGLFYAAEAHVDAIAAMEWLLGGIRQLGCEIAFASEHDGESQGVLIDCRGFAARSEIEGLRGVRGERIIVRAPEVQLSRPVRLLHPRQSIYVVPQGDGRFVIGATVIEREDDGPMTVKSALDLLATAYALDPAFAEAAIVDMGAGIRPAFADNVPKIIVEAGGHVIRVNGAYRHGFLLAPILARDVLHMLTKGEAGSLVHRSSE